MINIKNYCSPEISHAIMFHHFHGDKHSKCQGSINENEFDRIINFLSHHYNLINADEYIEKVSKEKLKNNDVCLTFDDSLKCQYDIAFPILKKNNLNAFFFIYSSPFFDNPDHLEIFRYFRNNAFNDIKSFYIEFFSLLENKKEINYHSIEKNFKKINYLTSFQFYSYEDRWFRYLRDVVLGKVKYNNIMFEMIKARNFSIKDASNNLWMTKENISELSSQGNIIGLHSFTHPTIMANLTYNEQKNEYSNNFKHLSQVLKTNEIISMSHPCGSYNDDTLDILKNLGIKVGFRSSLNIKKINSNLEIPREDHSNILCAINN